VTALDGLPITSPARTLLDLAATGLRGRPLEAALDRAELPRILDFAELHALLARHPHRAGSPSLTAVLARYHPGTVDTRSVLEELVIELCDAHRLPRPHVNTVVDGRDATSAGRMCGSSPRPTPTHGTAARRRSTTTASATSR